jgi:glutamyl-tRNA reductase
MGRLGHLSPDERSAVEGLASAIVNKLLHGSLVTLKTEADSAGGALFVEAARRFFNLDDAPAADRVTEPDRSVGPVPVAGYADPEQESSEPAQEKDS